MRAVEAGGKIWGGEDVVDLAVARAADDGLGVGEKLHRGHGAGQPIGIGRGGMARFGWLPERGGAGTPGLVGDVVGGQAITVQGGS